MIKLEAGLRYFVRPASKIASYRLGHYAASKRIYNSLAMRSSRRRLPSRLAFGLRPKAGQGKRLREESMANE